MPRGVSIIAQIARLSGAPAFSSTASAWRTVSALSTLGSSTASAPLVAAATRSSYPHGVPSALVRTRISRLPYPPSDSALTTFARASAFASGATASSRSKMRPSAGRPRAFSSARVLEPGMYRTLRRGRVVFAMICLSLCRCPDDGRAEGSFVRAPTRLPGPVCFAVANYIACCSAGKVLLRTCAAR